MQKCVVDYDVGCIFFAFIFAALPPVEPGSSTLSSSGTRNGI